VGREVGPTQGHHEGEDHGPQLPDRAPWTWADKHDDQADRGDRDGDRVPEGKEEPLVDTSACGGRDRAYPAFSFPIKYSELATATAKAVSCTHRRRQASSRAAAARNGQLTQTPPSRSNALAARVSGAIRIVAVTR